MASRRFPLAKTPKVLNMYEVIYKFKDLKDGDHIYAIGDLYPRDGYTPSSKRIKELSGRNNKIGKKLIRKVPAEVEE